MHKKSSMPGSTWKGKWSTGYCAKDYKLNILLNNNCTNQNPPEMGCINPLGLGETYGIPNSNLKIRPSVN